jgi:RimJ/RimL family protein N-acetyltransferase
MHAMPLNREPAVTQAPAHRRDSNTLPALYRELDERRWAMPALERRLPRLLQLADTLKPDHRHAWLAGLSDAWRRHGWALKAEGREDLMTLAAHWRAWPLVRSIGIALQSHALLISDGALHLIDAHRHAGDPQAALDLAVTMQLARPSEQRFSHAWRDLSEWQRWRTAMSPVDGVDWGEPELRLEPLGHCHLLDFALQYRDPAIAELCCLPDFRDDAHWHRWLAEIHALGDQRIFAVIHADWGWIGCVSLIRQDDAGILYYWIGADHRGHEYGSRAAALMLEAARRDHGLRSCFAKVLDYNHASRRTLDKLGFEDLQLSAAAPNEHEMFYRLGEPCSRAQAINRLHALLAQLECTTVAASPLQPG